MENNKIQNYDQPLNNNLGAFSAESNIPTPNNPPWNSLFAFLVWLASIFFIAIIPSIGVLIYLAYKGSNLNDPAKLKDALLGDPNAVLANILGVIPAHIATIFLAWIVVTYGRKYPFGKMLGWDWGGFKLIRLFGILIGFFVLAGIMGNFFPEKENDLIRILRSSRSAVFAVAFMATFTAPLVEEVIYRGIMYSAFQRTFGIPGAVILVTFLFALVHVPQYYPSYSTIFVICLLSLILTLIRANSDNLLPCFVLHTMFNGIQSALLILEPYVKQLAPNEQPAIFYWLN